MNLHPTIEQQAIRDAVRRYCAEQIPIERVRAWEKEGSGDDEALWQDAARLGWFGLGLPSAAGGSGLGLTEVACLLDECARGLVPRRVTNAIRAAYALARLEAPVSLLTRLGRGEEVATLAIDQAASHAGLGSTTCVDSDGAHVSGRQSYIADADRADWHVLAARQDAGVALLAVRRPTAMLAVLRTLDGDRQSHVDYVHEEIVHRLGAPATGEAQLACLRREQTALALAELLGAADVALRMTVDYVKQREQFGQKLAVFQAVQHQVSDMAMALTAARHLAWQAITRLANGEAQAIDLPAACAFVGQAAKRLTLSAHHLHGGAGFVVEHPLHYHSERAQALCIRYAPEGPALATVAAALLDAAD